MDSAIKILRGSDGSLLFWCPGCDEPHCIKSDVWKWNGSVEKPTFTPSVLVAGGHYAPGHTGDCWCTWNEKHPNDPTRFKCDRCHSFVKDGEIQFLPDSTHRLAGQTAPLPAWPDPEGSAS